MTDRPDEITKRLRRAGEEGARRFREKHPEIAARTRAELDDRAAELGHGSFDEWVAHLGDQMEREGRR